MEVYTLRRKGKGQINKAIVKISLKIIEKLKLELM